ncbi:MAG: 1-phosphofructokinase family hexose kinase [Planctomycetota bacterium]|jgi:fructose-1-phosphate kinase PfkB-like protein
MATVVTVTANPLLDYVCREPIRSGASTRGQLRAVAEGKGVNVARVLAAHGHHVYCCGFAGGHEGAHFAELLANDDLNPALTTCAAPLRVGFLAGDTPPTALLGHGFPVSDDEVAALLAQVDQLLSDADLLIVSGSVPDPSISWCYPALCARAHAHGVPCWIDSYGPALAACLDGATPPSLISPNRDEAGTLDLSTIDEVHLSDGSAAVAIRIGSDHYRVTPPPITEVNAIGSGDCYLAGLAHARLSGWPIAEQLRYACAAGAANASHGAVAEINPTEITALTPRVMINR